MTHTPEQLDAMEKRLAVASEGPNPAELLLLTKSAIASLRAQLAAARREREEIRKSRMEECEGLRAQLAEARNKAASWARMARANAEMARDLSIQLAARELVTGTCRDPATKEILSVTIYDHETKRSFYFDHAQLAAEKARADKWQERYGQILAMRDAMKAERDAALEKIDNAHQAASETQRSWKHCCYAIMDSLGLDFGDPDFEMPDEASRREQAEKERNAAIARAEKAEKRAQELWDERRQILQDCGGEPFDLIKERDAAKAEARELREGLETIANLRAGEPWHLTARTLQDMAKESISRIDAALAEKDKP